MPKLSNKSYIILFMILFVISTLILLIARISNTPVPAWGGYLDVTIVALIALTGFTIHQRNKNGPRFDVSYKIALYLFPLMMIGMWLYRNTLDFNILLPGVAWRTYFFLSILPHAIHLWNLQPHQ